MVQLSRSSRPSVPEPISTTPQEMTPSITPMYPTPITGNWGDLPCAWDERHRTTANSASPDAATRDDANPPLAVTHDEPAAAKIMSPPEPVADNAGATVNTLERDATVAYIDDPAMEQAVPSGDNSEVPSINNTNSAMPVSTPAVEPIVVPMPRTRNGRSSKGGSKYQASEAVAGSHDSAPRFVLPPAPPSRHTLQMMISSGAPFNTFYGILMTWYGRVVQTLSTTPSLRSIPACPPVAHYLHDFDGWLIELELWYSRYVLPQTTRVSTAIQKGPPCPPHPVLPHAMGDRAEMMMGMMQPDIPMPHNAIPRSALAHGRHAAQPAS